MSQIEEKKFFHSPILQDLTYVRLILNLYEREIGMARKANVLLYGHSEFHEQSKSKSKRYNMQHKLIKKALDELKLEDPGWSEYVSIDRVASQAPMILAEKNPDGKYDLPAQFHGLFDVVFDTSCFLALNYNLMDARIKKESIIILQGPDNENDPTPQPDKDSIDFLRDHNFNNIYKWKITIDNSEKYSPHTFLHVTQKNT
jgi:hypothetical protein